MDIVSFLVRNGIPTYSYPLITAISGEVDQQIGDTLSTDLGWVFGISTEINGSTPKSASANLPTLVQAGQLWLSLKTGQTLYTENYRLSNLVFLNVTSGDVFNQRRWLDVSIPIYTDLKKSLIVNPAAITGISTLITFHYITKPTYEYLLSQKLFFSLDKGTTKAA